jgi:cytochrome b subunit of formate dehydrogenase
MRTYLKFVVVLTFAGLILAGGLFIRSQSFAQPPEKQAPQPTPYLSANQQAQEFPTLVNLQCQGCHGKGKTLPNLGGEQFHKDAHGALDKSIHAQIGTDGRPRASCVDCHARGGDMTTMVPAEDPQSTVNRGNIAQTCGRCHNEAGRTFHLSIHGRRRDAGDPKPASCADCHGSHSIEPASDMRSQVNRTNTAETVCVKCHSDKVADWETSSHGRALGEGWQYAPTCTTCHTAVSHQKAPLSLRDFNMQMIAKCTGCHAGQAPSYRDTFHGQATALDFKLAATCADCHTPHRNLPKSDPRSSVNSANLVQTCSRCHTNANASFVTYDPHPRPHEPERSLLVYYVTRFMNWLLIGVFSFFGIHTLLWLQRSIVAWVRETHETPTDDEQYVVRFAPIHRFTHVLIVVSFLTLAATGLPLMFYYTDWGRALEQVQGGVTMTRFLHRVAALITLGYVVIHVSFIIRNAILRRKLSLLYGPESMVPRWQDFVDFFNMVRWFLYLGPRPKLDRWTYWEKFDYFAVFWGVPVIGLSGLMLWFPTFFTYFLPGIVLNLAMIIHGEEALLATAFIFAFHFFHNHLRPENFPMDIVIFTGKMTLSRFKNERPVEYERLITEGKLETLLTTPPTKRAHLISKIFGFTAYITGVLLVFAILATLIKHAL